ncbi:MAG TPA: hypothetical protein VJK49_04195 [Candidatus Limnocylindrales bacterium]|nr:hypothetical protein [Candidatus Limnocylindrales bacterium]
MSAEQSAIAAVSRRPTSDDEEWSWGQLPLLGLLAALGVVLVTIANRVGAAGANWGDLPFFAGLLLIVMPIAGRLLQASPRGSERLALMIVLGIALYACKIVHDPLLPGGYDEYLHVRTAQDMAQADRLFTPNSLLTVSPYYPGLELVTTALSQMAGIGIYEAGMVILAAARLVFVLALFFFFAMATGSSRVAGIAGLIYMTNSRFLYFDSQFAYESLALPLAAVALYLLARRGHSARALWLGLTVIAFLTIAAVVTTHHVTSAMLSLFLLLWAVVGVLLRRRDRARPGRMSLLAVALVVAWTLVVATATIGYLAPVLSTSLNQLLALISGELDPRQLFVSRIGVPAPLWERLVGSASAAVTLLLLPLGLLVVWVRHRSTPVVVALALTAMLFPLSLAARFAPIGAEVASRTPEFLSIGIGPVVALGLARFSYTGRWRVVQAGTVGALVAILAVGGVLVGMPAWARLPGPYLVSADRRSIESQGLAAAIWTRDVLGPDHAFVADRVNGILLATFGEQAVVTTYESRVPLRLLYLAEELGQRERRIVAQVGLEYLVADHRLTTGLPVVGHYFDRGEESVVGQWKTPLDPALLDKFDRAPDVSRVFDGGDIVIYDVSRLAAAQ